MSSELKKLIEELKPYDINKYKKLSNAKLLCFTMNFMNENRILTSFENICVIGHKFFPIRFGLLSDIHSYPDARIFDRTLRLHMKDVASGRVKTGFTLNNKGKYVAEQVKDILENPNSSTISTFVENSDIEKEVIQNRASTQTLKLYEVDISRIRGSKLFKYFLENNELAEIRQWDLRLILSYNSDWSDKDVNKKLNKLQDVVEQKHLDKEKHFLALIQEKLNQGKITE